MIKKERSLGITTRDKKKSNRSATRNYVRNRNLDNIEHSSLQTDTPNYSLIMECILGLNFLNFHLLVNHFPTTCWSLTSFLFC